MPTPKPGDAGYGSAPEGSLSEERAKKAAIWVEKEVYKLLGEIEVIGRANGNVVLVTFGELFLHYQDVSDTLVGIMARAKKRGLIQYEGQGGQMLFQGKHDSVVVTLDRAKSDQWKREYLSGQASGGNEPTPGAAVPKKQLTAKEQFDEEKKKRVSTSPATPSGRSNIISTPPKAPTFHESPSQVSSPPTAAAASSRPTPVETPTESNAGFLATMMGKLLPSSPKGTSSPPQEIPTNHHRDVPAPQVSKMASPPPAQPKKPVPKAQPIVAAAPPPPAPAVTQPVENAASLTRSIMSNLTKLLPSAPQGMTQDLDEGVLHSIKNSARQGTVERSSSPPPQPVLDQDMTRQFLERSSSPAPQPTLDVSSSTTMRQVHAALPQRTRDGTRGAVLKMPPTSPSAEPRGRPVSVAVSESMTAALKKEQEDWAKKHISRGVVSSNAANAGGAYAKLDAFKDTASKHKSTPLTGSTSSVAKKTNAFEKGKQSSTLPTGLQKRFAWE